VTAVMLACLLFADTAFQVRGHVVERDGRPLEGAQIDGRVTSGADGAFVLPIARGREHDFAPVEFLVRRKGYGTRKVRVRAGETPRIVLVVARTVRGLVQDQDGAPVEGARVRYGAAEATTGADGRYVMYDASQEWMRVSVFADGFFGVFVDLGEPIRLERLQTVRGRIGDGVHPDRPLLRAALYSAGTRIDRQKPLAVTDEGGRFEVECTRRPLLAVAPGFFVKILEVSPQAKNEFTLRKCKPLLGRIVAIDGTPVAGAEVLMVGPRSGIVRRTGADGAFRFDSVADRPGGFPPGFQLRVRHRDYVGVDGPVMVAELGTPFDIRLPRGSRVAGRILRDGRPAVGIRVAAAGKWAPPFVGGAPSWRRAVAAAFTDLSGRYVLPHVHANAEFVFAWDHESGRHGDARSMGLPVHGLDEGASVTLDDQELLTKLPLRGIVKSADVPRAGVTVRCEERSTKTDADGQFFFRDLPYGQYTVHFEGRQYFAWAGDFVVIDLPVLPRGNNVIRVHVKPPAGAKGKVRILVNSRAMQNFEKVVKFGAGPTLFVGLRPGTYTVRVLGEGCQEWETEFELEGPHEIHTIEAALVRGAGVSLRAYPNSVVVIETLRGRPAPNAVVPLKDGRAQVFGLGPGAYRFIVRTPGKLVITRDFEPGLVDEFDLRGKAAAKLRVRVVDLKGRPVAGARLLLENDDGYTFDTERLTDKTGAALLEELLTGEITVVARIGEHECEGLLGVEPGATHQLVLTLR